MIRQVFLRCNGGDYFTSEFCPFDGWTMTGFRQVIDHAAEMGDGVSHTALGRAGVPAEVLERVGIVEFPSADCVFEGLSPSHLVVDGKSFQLHVSPSRFK